MVAMPEQAKVVCMNVLILNEMPVPSQITQDLVVLSGDRQRQGDQVKTRHNKSERELVTKVYIYIYIILLWAKSETSVKVIL